MLQWERGRAHSQIILCSLTAKTQLITVQTIWDWTGPWTGLSH